MRKAILYTRVSTQAQAESGLGLEAQENGCRNFAAANGFEIVSVYTDKGISGTTEPWKRPALSEALQELRRGWTLLVWKLDRLGRNDVVPYIKYQLETTKKFLFSASGEGTLGTDLITDAYMFAIATANGKTENIRLKARTLEALAVKRANKEKLGGDLQFGFKIAGYKYKDDDGKPITVYGQNVGKPLIDFDPEQMEVIRRIIELRKNYKFREVVEIANREKLANKTWHITSVARIIKHHKAGRYDEYFNKNE